MLGLPCFDSFVQMVFVDPGGHTRLWIRGSRVRWIFSESKNPEYDFLWKGSKAMGPVVDLWHVKNLKPKLEPLSKICWFIHALCREVTLMT